MTPSAAACPAGLTPQRLGRIRSRLLAWYEAHGEDFPWRDACNPYWALVAGVCSQQTQMPRVLPLWRRWIEAFPTLEALAAADRPEVLRVWANAGYPRRALHLQEAARRCLEAHGGRLPREEAALLALPGVGPFTAAIVRCFGFGEDAAALDTNVARVVGRLLHGDLQPARETPPAALREGARRLLRPGTAARWNPALMDYGARVCLPRPRCEECAVASWCAARPRFAAGEQAEPLRAQPPFEGSDRQWRGRILAALRDSRRSLPVERLIDMLAASEGLRSPSPGRLRALLDELCAEGFAWRRGGRCGLGAPPGEGAAGADGSDSASLPGASDGRNPMAESGDRMVYDDGEVTIEMLTDVGPYGNSAYIVRPAGGGAVTLIDVPGGYEVVLEALGDEPVERLVVTHSHRDHWDGFDVMRAAIDAPVYAGAEETDIDPARGVERLADGEEIAIGDATMRVIHTPGHTPGSICLLLGGALFSGDTLFPGGPGASRSNELLQQEIASITSRLYPLPDETLVLPGHGTGTTIGESRSEYEVFASREHDPDLHGDVLWLES